MRWTGPLEAMALLTAVRVPARTATSTRGVLPWAPLVGVVLGGLATGVAVVVARWISPLAGAVMALAVLAILTRGLHLDGLADTADGLGPLGNRERALQIMHQSDVGPFGVAALVLNLLLQAACAAELLTGSAGWLPLWTAVVVARLAMARTGLPGVAVAAGSSLGRTVAGTVSRRWLAAALVLAAGLAAGAGLLVAGLLPTARLLAASGAGLLAAEFVHRRATARLGGTTGDVMGAMGEVATTACLVIAAALWP